MMMMTVSDVLRYTRDTPAIHTRYVYDTHCIGSSDTCYDTCRYMYDTCTIHLRYTYFRSGYILIDTYTIHARYMPDTFTKLTDTLPIHVSQDFVLLVQLMSSHDEAFVQPANGYFFSDKDKPITFKSNPAWLKKALTKLASSRLGDDTKNVVASVFATKYQLLGASPAYCPKNQREAQFCQFKGAVQRVWLAAEKAMEASGAPMHEAWTTVYRTMKMPKHLQGDLVEGEGESSEGGGEGDAEIVVDGDDAN
jgi:hypothetical protein